MLHLIPCDAVLHLGTLSAKHTPLLTLDLWVKISLFSYKPQAFWYSTWKLAKTYNLQLSYPMGQVAQVFIPSATEPLLSCSEMENSPPVQQACSRGSTDQMLLGNGSQGVATASWASLLTSGQVEEPQLTWITSIQVRRPQATAWQLCLSRVIC